MTMMVPEPLSHSSFESRIEPEPRRAHLYRRPPRPVYFPTSEEVPETNRHLEHRTALYLILKRELGRSATIGSDQFVYYDPTTAKKRLAPDVFVRLGLPHRTFRSWKIWERGAPELAVEITSDSDEGDADWNEKMTRYRSTGIGELVRFDAEDRSSPVRVWDLVDGDLVERASEDPNLLACEALGLWWTVVEDPALGPTLRLARDRAGRDLLPTPDELAVKALAEATKDRAEATKARKEATLSRKETAQVRADNERLQAELTELRALAARLGGVQRKPKKRP